MGVTHWRNFYIKDGKLFYLDSFGGHTDIFLLSQLTKLTTFHNYKIQKITRKLCCTYCLYFFSLTERMDYCTAILERYFEILKFGKCIC